PKVELSPEELLPAQPVRTSNPTQAASAKRFVHVWMRVFASTPPPFVSPTPTPSMPSSHSKSEAAPSAHGPARHGLMDGFNVRLGDLPRPSCCCPGSRGESGDFRVYVRRSLVQPGSFHGHPPDRTVRCSERLERELRRPGAASCNEDATFDSDVKVSVERRT